MFAKILDEKTITQAPRVVYIGETTYVNPTAEIYAELDYYEVTEKNTNETEPKKWYHLVNHYELKQNAEVENALPWIEHSYIEEKDEEPVYADLVNVKIRNRYSQSDEFAVLRQKDKSEEKRAEFEEYDNFCEACKAEAKAEIAEWRDA